MTPKLSAALRPAESPAMLVLALLLVSDSVSEQTPPSLPVRTSRASIDTGANNADSTAKKLRKAAKRLQKFL